MNLTVSPKSPSLHGLAPAHKRDRSQSRHDGDENSIPDKSFPVGPLRPSLTSGSLMFSRTLERHRVWPPRLNDESETSRRSTATFGLAWSGLDRGLELGCRASAGNFGEAQEEATHTPPHRRGHSFPDAPGHAKTLTADRSESNRSAKISLRIYRLQALAAAALRRIAIFSARYGRSGAFKRRRASGTRTAFSQTRCRRIIRLNRIALPKNRTGLASARPSIRRCSSGSIVSPRLRSPA